MSLKAQTFVFGLLFSSQARKLDVYFEYEEKLMSKSTLDKSLLDIISDPDGEQQKGITDAFYTQFSSDLTKTTLLQSR